MGFDELAVRYDGVIATHDELNSESKPPSEAAANKVIDHIDDHCARFIGAAPFIAIGTRGRHGWMDVSPKGDPAGFVKVVDRHTLVIPDRLGNNRHDTLHNLIDDPAIGLIFLVPQRTETLRVSGRARVVRDQALRDSMAMNGKAPKLAIVVAVEQVLYHCGKCMIRSNMWNSEAWPDISHLSSLATAIRDHAQTGPTCAGNTAIYRRQLSQRTLLTRVWRLMAVDLLGRDRRSLVDHLICKPAGQFCHMIERKAKRTGTLGQRSKLDDQVAQFRLRQHAFHRVPAAPAMLGVEAENLPAVAGDQIVDLAGVLRRHVDRNLGNRLQQHRVRGRHRLSHGQLPGGPERLIGTVHAVELAVVESH